VERRRLVVQHRQFPTAAKMVDGAVDRDPLEPRPERTGLVEAIQRAERFLNRLLGSVVGQRPVGGDRVGGAPGERPVTVEERCGRVGRAGAG
jgi:hypothetical protein